MSDRVFALVAEGEEAARELPMPVLAYFFIVFAIFLVLLGITWTFRNTAYKVRRPSVQDPRHPGGADRAHPGAHDGAHH
jgi:hypothetical protein